MTDLINKYKKIFDEVLDMIFVCDLETGNIIDCNQAASDMLGWKKEELIGQHQTIIHPPQEIAGRFSRTFLEHTGERTEDILESQVIRKDGTVFDVIIKASIFELNGEKVILEIFHDITEKKRQEKELENIAAFPEEYPHPIFRVTREGRIIYSNPAGQSLLSHWQTEIGQYLPPFLCRELKKVEERNEREYLEIPLDRKSYQFVIIPVSGEDYLNIYSMDITDRIEAEKALRKSEERCSLAQKSARIGSWDWDVQKDKLHWSENIEFLFGMERGSFKGTYEAFLELVHPDDRDFLENAVHTSLEKGGDYNFEHRIIRPDGSVQWLRETGKSFLDQSGHPRRMLGIVQDITNGKEIMEQIALLTRAVEQSSVSVVITDLEGNIVYVNPGFTEVTGYSTNEVIGRNPRILKSGKQGPHFYKELWDTITTGKDWKGEFCNVDKYGKEFWERASISPVKDHWGNPLYYVAVKEDITERKKQEEKIEYLALHDSLTGLYNRISFLDHLKKDLNRAVREGNKLALFYFDLDGFKPINDDFGHMAGDKVLQKVAERLQSSVRKMDIVARVGGDEFAILLPEFHSREEVKEIAERILTSIAASVHLENACCRLGASIGITTYPEDGDTADVLLHKADQAMYKMKKSGRNNYNFYSDERKVPATS